MTTPAYPEGPRTAAGLLAATQADHQAGRLDEAESGYRRLLETDPDHADALHLLGVVRHQRGDEGAAVAFISTHAAALAALGNLDLRITTYTGIVYLPACALTEFSPDPASDQSSMIHYGFIGGNYTTTAP